MYLTLKTLGCRKNVLHANMPISHSYYHNMTTERQHKRQLKRGRTFTRQKVKQTFGNLHKGSLIGVTHTHITTAGKKKFKREKTSVGFGEQFIEEKILMLSRHSRITVKLMKQEIALTDANCHYKIERLKEVLQMTKRHHKAVKYVIQNYLEANKWRKMRTKRDHILQILYTNLILDKDD